MTEGDLCFLREDFWVPYVRLFVGQNLLYDQRRACMTVLTVISKHDDSCLEANKSFERNENKMIQLIFHLTLYIYFSFLFLAFTSHPSTAFQFSTLGVPSIT